MSQSKQLSVFSKDFGANRGFLDVRNQKAARRAVLLELYEEHRRGDGVWLALAVSALAVVMLSLSA